ncbi:hypothetical protein KEM48_004426 [Puccinia striiformis f. sp. tritici PST-130]|nr:hypothetical protein KEM48_004426 [Puccinia striiformis f. sp. tritici PST-130]
MSSLINFKAIQGIIVVGPLAELNNEQIIQCFTPDVVQLMIDHLPENFCPSEGCPKLVVENDPETCHALYIKDHGMFSLGASGLISADDPPNHERAYLDRN